MNEKNNKNAEVNEKELQEMYDKFQEALKNPKTTMTKEMLAEMKKKVSESISINRQRLVVIQPFTGGMLMRLEIVPVRDYRVPTAQTDGKRIYFDIDFYKNLTDGERKFVLAHECWHNIYLHFLRKKNRNSALWNIATDCEINYMLKNEGFEAPEELCYPEPEDEGKSAEEIYERILKKAKKQSKEGNQNKNNGSSKGGGYGGTGYGKDNVSKNKMGGKNGNTKLKDQFDKHTEQNKDKDSDSKDSAGDGSGMLPTDEWGEKGEDEDYNPMIDQNAAERIREGVIAEAQKVERSKGTLPGGLTSILNKLRKPEISWKHLLATEITKVFTDKKTWLPPSRRHVYEEMYFQSRRGEKVSVDVVIDTSGSCTADLPKFMGEVVSLLNSFSNYDMELIQCDAKIQSIEKYDDCNPFPVEDCSKIKFSGFGGSDFRPAFDYLQKKDEIPHLVIFFTDGYIDVPKDPPPFDVLWILTSDGNKEIANYGKKIVFKEKISNDDF